MKAKFKPYQHVWVNVPAHVEGGTRRFIGEVMSYPIPSEEPAPQDRMPEPGERCNTIMVRTVPGHSGTLQEFRLDQIEPCDIKITHVLYARAHGVGEFPVDMLRYDSAVPVNFSFTEDRWGKPCVPVIDPKHGLDGLWVARAAGRRWGNWTEARWASFMWKLYDHRAESL